MKKWFYVLELTGGRYYVGISNNLVRRARQHHEGKGAVWTKLHSPVNLLFQHEHDVPDDHAAYNIENEMTVKLMVEHGWKKVRGGYFCAISDVEVEKALRSHGYWDQVLQSTVQITSSNADWNESVLQILEQSIAFHQSGCSDAERCFGRLSPSRLCFPSQNVRSGSVAPVHLVRAGRQESDRVPQLIDYPVLCTQRPLGPSAANDSDQLEADTSDL